MSKEVHTPIHPRNKEVMRVPNNAEAPLSDDELLECHHYMILTRAVEEAIVRLYRQGKIVGGAYTGRGNEATSVGSAFCLEREDYLFPLHRDLGAHLVKGQSVRNVMLQHLGRKNSLTGGRDGTGHYADPSLRIYGNISHLAAMIPLAAGVALAGKLRQERCVVMTYIGDGGCNLGDFHESLAMCSVMKLPLVLIIENNQFAYSTPIARQFAAEHLSDRALGYGIPGVVVDGTDVEEVYAASKHAVERARAGEGPTLIESVTMRMEGHSAHDSAEYVPSHLLEEWKKKDPILKTEERLTAKRLLTAEAKRAAEQKMAMEIDDAIQFALESPYPSAESAGMGVFAV